MNEALEPALRLLAARNPASHSRSSPRSGRLRRVLVANRGEIARRFFFALREEGIRSVAVVADVDRNQSWHEFADEVLHIGGSASYANPATILAAAIYAQANAIYPGYGFLSENARFVQMIEQYNSESGQNIVFMGPAAQIMQCVGSKLDARRLARAAGIALFAGSDQIESDAQALGEADRIGYPVMVKLNAGGGGKGMSIVHSPAELPAALESSRRIGAANYQDASLYLERYIAQPVHVEVQIFNGMAIGLRKCAVQRRNQKIIEESAHQLMPEATVVRLFESAELLARACGYDRCGGAGTVEFLYDQAADQFGFLEMNTRLQVEYAVTDQSLGVDLVRWQILCYDDRQGELQGEFGRALAQRLRPEQHAIECRIYAEDPCLDYAPSPGALRAVALPAFNGIRCDFGYRAGDQILSDYDPMIGKLIAHGPSRAIALNRLKRALGEIYIAGVITNIDQLLAIVRHDAFLAGDYNNRLLADSVELQQCAPVPTDQIALTAALFALGERCLLVRQELQEAIRSTALLEQLVARGGAEPAQSFAVQINDAALQVDLRQTGLWEYEAYVDGVWLLRAAVEERAGGQQDFLITVEKQRYAIWIDRHTSTSIMRLLAPDGQIYYRRGRLQAIDAGVVTDGPGLVRCPFPARFVRFGDDAAHSAVQLKAGCAVQKGDALIVIEAMKMEMTLVAPISGVLQFLYRADDAAQRRQGHDLRSMGPGAPLAQGDILADVAGSEPSSSARPPAIGASAPFAWLALDPEERQWHAAWQLDCLAAARQVLSALRRIIFGFSAQTRDLDQARVLCSELLAAPELEQAGPVWQEVQSELREWIAAYTSMHRLLAPARDPERRWLRATIELLRSPEHSAPPLSDRYRSATARILLRLFAAGDGQNIHLDLRSRFGLFHLLKLYRRLEAGAELLLRALPLLGRLQEIQPSTERALERLIGETRDHSDERLANEARRILAAKTRHNARNRAEYSGTGLNRLYAADFRRFILEPFVALPGEMDSAFREHARASLSRPGAELFPTVLAPATLAEVRRRAERRLKTHELRRLYSPYSDVILWQVESRNDASLSYHCMVCVGEGAPVPQRDASGAILGAPNVEQSAIRALRVLRAYDHIARGKNNLVEILAFEHSLDLDLFGIDPRRFNQSIIRRVADRIMRFFLHARAHTVLLELRSNQDRRDIRFALDRGRVVLDLLQPEDPAHPCHSHTPAPGDERLFARGKWPVEIWARECFDAGSFEQLFVPCIDRPDVRGGPAVEVGAHIFRGTIAAQPALFYMKDSRIQGGATGDLEGQKYVAAVYLAYLYDLPLYVWNDGAGANVRQGMVSLNRAAQGFMMNAVCGDRCTYSELFGNLQRSGDATIQSMAAELDRMHGFDRDELADRRPRRFLMVAVGQGSSTGLDVYGSSQAALQLMLDHPESYRVLTGSVVIRSVTGEDLSNYDIGGARVMGRMTGVVDLVGADRIDLMYRLRLVHKLLGGGAEVGVHSIERIGSVTDHPRSAQTVLSPDELRAHVDQGIFVECKGQYRSAEEAFGGLARFAGQSTMIVALRNNDGIWRRPSLIKIRDLLRSAHKLGLPRIIIHGAAWEGGAAGLSNAAQQMDLLETLREVRQPRLHLVTDPRGLERAEVLSGADATVCLCADAARATELRGAADFVAPDLRAAFDWVADWLGYVCRRTSAARAASGNVEIPRDPTQPFDMRAVIESLVDGGAALYLRHWTGTSEPNLILALARIEGRAIALIADQPFYAQAPDAPGTERFRRFMQFVDRRQLPLLMLCNAPGFTPGSQQERLRIQQIGGESLDVNVLSRGPIVSVVLNQNYGGRQIQAFSRYLRPGVIALALSRARMGVMGEQAAFDLFSGTKYRQLLQAGEIEAAQHFRERCRQEYDNRIRASGDALATSALDWLLDEPQRLRSEISRALDIACRQSRRTAAAGGRWTAPGFG
ncbi:MAG: hypothetical protein K1X75_07580 [Leptospirales bacterium]|nr:hypothetical protein [Leptospirales bacterium]